MRWKSAESYKELPMQPFQQVSNRGESSQIQVTGLQLFISIRPQNRQLKQGCVEITVCLHSCAGIGFAKTKEGNCELIRDLRLVRGQLQGCLAGQPMLAGPSRKGFLGWLTGNIQLCSCTRLSATDFWVIRFTLWPHSRISRAGLERASERDIASAVASSMCIAGGANIIRMHSAAAGRDAVRVTDGILRS